MTQQKTRHTIYSSSRTVVVGILLLCILSSGCAQIRLVTYPDKFVWLDRQDVQGTMHEMYQTIQNLDLLIASDTTSLDNSEIENQRAMIISNLDSLESTALRLIGDIPSGNDENTGAPVTNHLLLDEHMDDFISQVAQARFRAEANPPDYYATGRLTGECNACHRRR